MLADADMSRLARIVAEGTDAMVVGVFGSHATGLARPYSDLDLFVIGDSHLPGPTRVRVVRQLLFAVLQPLDIHVFTPAEFEEEVDEYLSFTWVIARQARIFHAVPEAVAQVPSLADAIADFERRKSL